MGNDIFKKKKPTPPPPIQTKNVGIAVFAPDGSPVKCEIYINGNHINDRDSGGAIAVDIWNVSVGLVIRNAPGFKDYSAELDLPPTDSKNFDVTLVPLAPPKPVIKPAQPIQIVGNKFAKRIQERDAFTGLEVFVKQGKDALLPYYAECRKYNVTTLRVFCSLFGWADLDPRQYPMYRGFVRDYIEFSIEQGFNLELDALVGPELQGGFDKELVQMVSDISADYPETLFKIGNELWRWYNVAGLKSLAEVVNKKSIWAVTSPKMEGNDDPSIEYILPLPENKSVFFHGKWISIHSIRGEEQARRGKDITDIQGDYGVPCLMNEPFGSGFEAGRTNEPRQFIEYSAASSLFGGSCFHSDRSIKCQTLDGDELKCLEAFSTGWTLIPEEFMNGHYTRYGSAKFNDFHPDCPIGESAEPLLRSYFMILGNRAMGVLIKQTNGEPKDFTPNWVNGWKVAGNIGPVYKLEQ